MSGWIKLHRKLCENEIWLKEEFSRGQAWVDLLLLASHKDTHFWKRGVLVEQKRGQVGVSVAGLALRWKWSRNKVKKFLNDLEKVQQIEQQNNNVTSMITLIKYDQYQEIRTAERAASEAASEAANDTAEGLADEHNQEVKKEEVKKEEEKNNNGSRFEPLKVRPDFISVENWQDIIAHRRNVKATNTERAYSALVKEIKSATDQGFSVEQCVDEMTNRSWTGFKADWMKRSQNGKAGNSGKGIGFAEAGKSGKTDWLS
jgi:hypothetical protein